MKKNLDFVEQLLTAPEEAIESIDLVYVDDKKLPIQRIPEKESFNYQWDGKPVLQEDLLQRIKGLVIPPAWDNVKITHLSNGHLQAVGRDAKKRKQYRYHPKWTKIRSRTKFYKMISFGEQLPKIRERVDKDLLQKGWPKSKVAALVIRLMEETHIRIGNEQYARRNKTYGLTTLRTKHLHAYKDKLRFEFIGKKGKEHSVTLRNKRLIKLVSQMEELSGWELFQFYDRDGNKQSVDSTMVNEYLHKISGDIFSAKDFRTWAASLIFFESLKALPKPTNIKQKHKNILTAFDSAAKELGNSRSVCRRSYVHPFIVNSYEEGSLQEYFDKVDTPKEEKEYFSASESAVLDLIGNFKPLKTLD